MSRERRNDKRVRDARLHILIAVAALPLLVSCSSSSSVEYATDAYPSQSLVDLLKESRNSPAPAPPAPSTASPAPAATNAELPAPAPTAPPAREPPPAPAAAAANPPPAIAATVANPQPPTTTPAGTDDPVAAAFPSVSLIDLMTGRKPGSQ
ncbi:MAG: hypothetical protein JO084_13385 [Bradyrhizobiaceae bacterium]|nr:hypothetical protein [Hyphomicrobiales bacterium]MBV9428710.1 hypothetical protein [Bradyrhizobiaceae bacterium]